MKKKTAKKFGKNKKNIYNIYKSVCILKNKK